MARILIAEDEPITAADLEQTLVGMGHELAGWVDSGEDAVTSTDVARPDLVLMDIRLRGPMTGIEAAEQIRAHSAVPVVFLTAFADEDTVCRACGTRPYGYLVKPFTERTVAVAVQVALARVADDRATAARAGFVRSALRCLDEAIVAIDEHAAVRFLNARAEALLGITEVASVGADARDVVRLSPSTPETGASAFHRAVEDGGAIGRSEDVVLLRRDGSQVLASFASGPVLDEAGRRIGVVMALRERAIAQRAIEGAHPRDVAAIPEPLRHAISNPLTYSLGALALALHEVDRLGAVTLGATTLAAADVPSSEAGGVARVRGLLRAAHEGASRIAEVMRGLRDAPLPAERIALVDPVEIADVAVGLTGASLARIRVDRVASQTPLVRATFWQLARTLADELERAAARYRGSAITLAVAVGAVGTRARVRFELHADPAGDSGDDADTMPVPSPSSIAAAAMHGADLTVEATPGGCRIELVLPAAGPRRAGGADLTSAEPAGRGRILVVDDEPVIGRVLEIVLGRKYEVKFVDSGRAALSLLTRDGSFDVILCDLTMPGMSGRELHERLVASRPDLASRLVLMTGGARDARDREFLSAMEGRRIDKPFHAETLERELAARIAALRAREGVEG